MIRADLSAGGLNPDLPCVYVVIVTTSAHVWCYVGRTGTSNRTGRSTPFGRLGKHLAKVGNTQSCLYDTEKIPPEVLRTASLRFAALPLEDDFQVRGAERWLRWRMPQLGIGQESMLNREPAPTGPPELPPSLLSLLEDFVSELP